MPLWHLAQVSAIFARLMLEAASALRQDVVGGVAVGAGGGDHQAALAAARRRARSACSCPPCSARVALVAHVGLAALAVALRAQVRGCCARRSWRRGRVLADVVRAVADRCRRGRRCRPVVPACRGCWSRRSPPLRRGRWSSRPGRRRCRTAAPCAGVAPVWHWMQAHVVVDRVAQLRRRRRSSDAALPPAWCREVRPAWQARHSLVGHALVVVDARGPCAARGTRRRPAPCSAPSPRARPRSPSRAPARCAPWQTLAGLGDVVAGDGRAAGRCAAGRCGRCGSRCRRRRWSGRACTGPRRGCSRSSASGCCPAGCRRTARPASPSLWQRPHMNGMLNLLTRDAGSRWGRMSCAPWQSQQCGAYGAPRLDLLPVQAASVGAWRRRRGTSPQSTGASVSACGKSSTPGRSWWQSTQAVCSLPWTDFAYFAAST